jgi:MGT family glycosyltransferase
MSRVLVVVPPLAGHVNPLAALAAELERRDHTVAWVAHPRAVRPLLPPGAAFYPVDDEHPLYREREQYARSTHLRGFASVKFFFESVLAPLAEQMLPVADAAVDDFAPTLVVADQYALAGAFAARRHRVRWVTSSPTTGLYPGGGYERYAGVREWIEQLLRGLERDAGLPATARPDLSPDLVLVHSSRAFAGGGPVPPQLRFVGPLIGERPPRPGFPWDALRPGRRVLVTLGSTSSEHARPFSGIVAEAAAGLPCQVVLDAPPEHVPHPPANLLVAHRAPVLELLANVDAVVCHAGSTVHEALAYGLPLVVAPIRDDQPTFAERVVATGTGIRIRFGRLRPAELRDAVLRVLSEPSWRAAAERIRDSFREAGGVPRAADEVEALAARTGPGRGARAPAG